MDVTNLVAVRIDYPDGTSTIFKRETTYDMWHINDGTRSLYSDGVVEDFIKVSLELYPASTWEGK